MKNIWILSRISKNKYGDSTRPYFLGRYMQTHYNITQYCKINDREKGVNYIKFFDELSIFNLFKIFKKVFYLHQKKDKINLDILYTHQLLLSFIGAVFKLFNPRVLFVADFHSCDFFEIKHNPNKGIKHKIKKLLIPLYEKFVTKKADIIITVSKETKNVLKEYYNVSETKIKVIKNGTDINSTLNSSVNLNPYKLSKTNNFLCVFPNPRDGFISNDLAIDFLIKMANKIIEKDSEIKFIILGGGKIPKNYPKNIIFTGYVNNYSEWLNIANICIATYPENAVCGGVRNKICDYLAVGKPIIATTESMRGFDDLKENINFFKCDDVASFTNKLLAIKNTDLSSMSKLNIKKSKEYTWKNRANELKDVLKTM